MSIKELLSYAKTIAVIGCSSKQYRTSYIISEYLLDVGYEIVPVNPNESSVFGRTCYPSVFDIPDEIRIDIVDIFRNKRYTVEMVRDIVNWSESKDKKPAIWTQLDVSTPSAKEYAEANGHLYRENRCMLVEHQRFN